MTWVLTDGIGLQCRGVFALLKRDGPQFGGLQLRIAWNSAAPPTYHFRSMAREKRRKSNGRKEEDRRRRPREAIAGSVAAPPFPLRRRLQPSPSIGGSRCPSFHAASRATPRRGPGKISAGGSPSSSSPAAAPHLLRRVRRRLIFFLGSGGAPLLPQCRRPTALLFFLKAGGGFPSSFSRPAAPLLFLRSGGRRPRPPGRGAPLPLPCGRRLLLVPAAQAEVVGELRHQRGRGEGGAVENDKARAARRWNCGSHGEGPGWTECMTMVGGEKGINLILCLCTSKHK
ncbi:unnamed protein product [Urochloa humidicola]